MRTIVVLCLAALLLAGCVVSRQPLIAASSGPIPLPSGTYRVFNIFTEIQLQEFTADQKKRCFPDIPGSQSRLCDLDSNRAPMPRRNLVVSPAGDISVDGAESIRTLRLSAGRYVFQYLDNALYKYVMAEIQGSEVRLYVMQCGDYFATVPGLTPLKSGECEASDVNQLQQIGARFFQRHYPASGLMMMYRLVKASTPAAGETSGSGPAVSETPAARSRPTTWKYSNTLALNTRYSQADLSNAAARALQCSGFTQMGSATRTVSGFMVYRFVCTMMGISTPGLEMYFYTRDGLLKGIRERRSPQQIDFCGDSARRIQQENSPDGNIASYQRVGWTFRKRTRSSAPGYLGQTVYWEHLYFDSAGVRLYLGQDDIWEQEAQISGCNTRFRQRYWNILFTAAVADETAITNDLSRF